MGKIRKDSARSTNAKYAEDATLRTIGSSIIERSGTKTRRLVRTAKIE